MELGLLSILANQLQPAADDAAFGKKEGDLLDSSPFRNVLDEAVHRMEKHRTLEQALNFSKEYATNLLSDGFEGVVHKQVNVRTEPLVQPLAGMVPAILNETFAASIEATALNEQTVELDALQVGLPLPEVIKQALADMGMDNPTLSVDEMNDVASLPVFTEGEGARELFGEFATGETAPPQFYAITVTTVTTVVMVLRPGAAGLDTAEQLVAMFNQEQTPFEAFWDQLQAQSDQPIAAFFAGLADMPEWHQLSIGRTSVAATQLMNTNATTPQEISQPVMSALAQDDISQLSKDELAELDRLIDNIGKGLVRKGGFAPTEEGMNFRNLVQQNLAEQAAQKMPDVAQAKGDGAEPQPTNVTPQPTAHSASVQDAQFQRVIVQQGADAHMQRATPTEQVQVTIQQAAKQGMDRVIIQLDPPEMGRVDVRLELVADGRSQVVVQADNRETLEMLQRDARLLEKALQETGVDADASSMEFSLNQEQDERDETAGETGTDPALLNEYDENAAQDNTLETVIDPVTGHYMVMVTNGVDMKV